ncbi:MAG TPA: LPS export ABC transporter ATP-binding protein [Verrucomicrobia bacterium]|nr:LPS export ABC transporter ATP-binding protein [Verrucomicrobiota bacterium]
MTEVNETCLVEAMGLAKSYRGKTVVSDVSIRVMPGEIVGLLGPNGAGKTTSFYMIVGLVKADGGRVLFKGQDITAKPMYKRARMGIGYLSQEPSIFRKLTVRENVLAILETMNLSRGEMRSRLDALLEELDLARLANQRAFTLSGGERRRLEITRALVTNPAILMLDEPFSGVDPLAVADVQRIIMQLQRRGLGILITDHNVRETLAIVDRAYLLYEGKVLREGASSFLINDQMSRELYLGTEFKM